MTMTATANSWFTKMFGNPMTLDNLEAVLLMQLRDLASAEDQLIQALPKMADAAACDKLRSAFQNHLRETKRQRARLDEAFQLLGADSHAETCEAMQGLIAEGNEVINLEGDPELKDLALIAAAQRVEHYEMAGYGCARTFAQRLGFMEVADLLQETLNEEGNADKMLTSISEAHLDSAT